jgi:hypothetical protein
MDKEEKKEFERLKRRTTKLLQKDLEFTDLEIAAISRVGHAESMKDITWLVVQQMERIFESIKLVNTLFDDLAK